MPICSLQDTWMACSALSACSPWALITAQHGSHLKSWSSTPHCCRQPQYGDFVACQLATPPYVPWINLSKSLSCKKGVLYHHWW